MALSDFFSGASDMLNKAKHLVEETTGIDVDNAVAHPGDLLDKAKDAIAHPEALMEQAKAKGSELFSKFTGNGAAEAQPTVENKAAAETKATAAKEDDEEEEEDDNEPAVAQK